MIKGHKHHRPACSCNWRMHNAHIIYESNGNFLACVRACCFRNDFRLVPNRSQKRRQAGRAEWKLKVFTPWLGLMAMTRAAMCVVAVLRGCIMESHSVRAKELCNIVLGVLLPRRSILI